MKTRQYIIETKNFFNEEEYNAALEDLERQPQNTGGDGDNVKPSELDPFQLRMGAEIEFEHTFDHVTAIKIAIDHLFQELKTSGTQTYYDRLQQMETEMGGAPEEGQDMEAQAGETGSSEENSSEKTPEIPSQYPDSKVESIRDYIRETYIKMTEPSPRDAMNKYGFWMDPAETRFINGVTFKRVIFPGSKKGGFASSYDMPVESHIKDPSDSIKHQPDKESGFQGREGGPRKPKFRF